MLIQLGDALICNLLPTGLASDHAQPTDALAPGCTLPVRLRLSLAAAADDKDKEKCLSVTVRVTGVGVSSGDAVSSPPVKLALRCRKAAQPFLFTFIDHDGTVAHAATIKPRTDSCPNGGPCPLSVSAC